ncbi:flagellar hook-length control protein FliK [Curvibacter sp. CHRR-16]|uniref:flagellar hook-length control protein FliK n=1 Tax=Curvibacter sp. CHRR-16 TaxID=2835872 RepID=UPI001BDB5ADF|nr:flagellar hook-length control protein FliK [Curvibacter sp. CHRR-16]MBT0569519.1 flagellar hook-length control protein FliK [Curvibacter sp. CHRR-16]
MSTMSPVPPAPQHASNRPAADKKSAPEKKASTETANSGNADTSGAAGNAAALDFLALLSMADAALPVDDSAAVVADDSTALLAQDATTAPVASLDPSAWAAMAAVTPRAADGIPNASTSAASAGGTSTLSLGKDAGADVLGGSKAAASKAKKANEALLAGAVAVAGVADALQRKEDALWMQERKQAGVHPLPEMVPMQVTQTVVAEATLLHKPLSRDPEWVKKQDAASPMPDAGMVGQDAHNGGIMGVDGIVATGAVLELDRYQQEDVVFWGNGDVQNADVTVMGMDGDPLGITVSMQGNEAQVAFRTDVPEVRSALEASNHQLRETLNAHGMGLAGVSVGQFGQSGAGGDGPSDGRSRSSDSGRKAQVAALSPQAGLSTRSPTPRTGSGLDLYV